MLHLNHLDLYKIVANYRFFHHGNDVKYGNPMEDEQQYEVHHILDRELLEFSLFLVYSKLIAVHLLLVSYSID
jgi:hypothetical protein